MSTLDHAAGSQLMTALTTEHYTLQSARSAAVLESNGRSNLFVATITGSTVALALVAQLHGLGQPFRLFALVVLPAVLVLGLLSYDRLAELALEDAEHQRSIERIRAAYRRLEPELDVLLGAPTGSGQDRPHSHRHHLGNPASTVSALVAVLVAVLAGLSSTALGTQATLAVGGGSATAVLAALVVDQERRWRRAFPSPAGPRRSRCGRCAVLVPA